MKLSAVSLCVVLAAQVSGQAAVGQEYGDYGDYGEGYGDYGQDTLYQDYADKQQKKLEGGGGGMGKMVIGGALGWLAGGKFHSNRTKTKLNKKHKKEQKALYTQYYNDVYQLQTQNAELAYLAEQLKQHARNVEEQAELDALQRDYDEFKQPDVDGDDRISRAEFNHYVKNYLSNYPGLTEKDMPKFEDFDHDNDGSVSFAEYTEQMALQTKMATKK
mmetsp:Transcript_6743/g.9877  ORF Transcript_6743/g.9877 Transcript_6743/m.9877 type:complete len:217 (-) Transcript_6743:122-772(-)|eukprot:CAMPEP_0196809452 /NCGR_PEP_ID=MMETSP1362-20130617/9391_1 /TAXON_ID=163516 /ORGANISM="Leptocylindrus danicus, Strain CCMP1856" /LENGTH=216 /DNA_ID=CAMNT_0042184151 /DNA_START=124 /DNA_END=774 /DNA_ORIENTATION=+